MDKDRFNAILTLKIGDLISLIMIECVSTFETALDYLYVSKLYEILSDEDTKLWHLSAEKLFDMLKNEKMTHELVLPDFV